jgi:hypothetical protein
LIYPLKAAYNSTCKTGCDVAVLEATAVAPQDGQPKTQQSVQQKLNRTAAAARLKQEH